jgi:cysteine desulfuration protein SufE
MRMEEQVAQYQDDLSLFESDHDKYDYIVDLGNGLVPLDPQYKIDEYLVKGCSSRAWLHQYMDGDKIVLESEGESLISKGMLVILLSIFSNRTPDEILAFDPASLDQMGVKGLLSPVRQQGLEAFLNYIYTFAKTVKEAS